MVKFVNGEGVIFFFISVGVLVVVVIKVIFILYVVVIGDVVN